MFVKDNDRWFKMRKMLVDELRLEGYIRSEKVYKAMLRVPRELFVPPDYRDLAYDDRPLPIGHGQTISAPSIVAFMTELLDLDVGMKVLEVGTGSGYQAAVLAEVVAPSDVERQYWGHVYSIERIEALADLARRNLEKAGYSDRVTVIVGDGSKGYSEEAPYDRIMVTAAAPKIPEPLINQLKPGGRLVIPVGGVWDQTLYLVEKTIDGRVEKKPTLPVLFVPLIGDYAWPENH